MKVKNLIIGCWVTSVTLFACSTSEPHTQNKQLTPKEESTATELLSPIKTSAKQSNYRVNTSASGKPYYHLSYVLNSNNIVQIERYTWQEFEQNGGQFEVTLDKAGFPIPAPNCKSNLLLRMPWVPPGTNLSAKYQLYQAILAVQSAQAESVTVAVELNPYVQTTLDGLALTQCNIFFRHANHQYVPHTESLH